ncbi:MAG: hypothetical protein FD161_2611 [Limisphaerales bacterium]|nr:MAG: hypothetical protein FD161_2611 [Limisphaerales bacterium]KAG0508428.1 MAG: hypothetical protein E1N63_2362 [Limisphaerales bacterium]TXT47924.1 MAG: hypothetical protein FD140_3967 [Limisphaerales bacterium]
MRNSFYCLLAALLLVATGVPHCVASVHAVVLFALALGIVFAGIALDWNRWSKQREDD